MAGITVRNLDQPDETYDFGEQGRSDGVTVGESTVWRSTLRPGWSWERNIKPEVGLDACPLYHREYVVSGRIRYRMIDGTEAEGGPGDHLVIEPGHMAEVVGEEACVLLDW